MSRFLYPFERRLLWERRRRWAIALLSGYIVLSVLDRAIYRLLYVGIGVVSDQSEEARRHFEARDWASMAKAVGYLPLWMALAAALAVAGRLRDGARVAGAAALGGGLADLLKPIVGRVRPHLAGGEHLFRHVKGLADDRVSYGMASSHAGVAFGAAFMLVFLYGRPGLVAVVLALACGLERVMSGAHFATDVYVGALLGYASARVFRPGGWRGERDGWALT